MGIRLKQSLIIYSMSEADCIFISYSALPVLAGLSDIVLLVYSLLVASLNHAAESGVLGVFAACLLCLVFSRSEWYVMVDIVAGECCILLVY